MFGEGNLIQWVFCAFTICFFLLSHTHPDLIFYLWPFSHYLHIKFTIYVHCHLPIWEQRLFWAGSAEYVLYTKNWDTCRTVFKRGMENPGEGNNGKTDTIYPQKAVCACFQWHMTNMVLFFFSSRHSLTETHYVVQGSLKLWELSTSQVLGLKIYIYAYILNHG